MDIPIRLIAAVVGGHKFPSPFFGNRHDETGEGCLRSCRLKQGAAIQKKPHRILPGFLQGGALFRCSGNLLLGGALPEAFSIFLVCCNPFLHLLQRDVAYRHGSCRVHEDSTFTQFHEHHGVLGTLQPQSLPDLRRESDRPALRNGYCSHAAILQYGTTNVKPATGEQRASGVAL